ncbi:Rrf2 family transcriptional regulator [Magnetospirillum sp. SS-4]|uniref:RrF2 family transcriptional regulator n=1 Tax=Magnetospirillum sp. SS-4 TaxID=2681465 RepID=UPI001383125D|nr:Rrf2 family transcriptional regulator [Magnetospirillum sp. SS-4]CAA7624831.1 Predicted transcriptional regulator [Magnetospirillum sp. SS-4]
MLSSKAKYGLKAMIYLSRHEGRGPSLIADVADSERIPKKFLDAILLELKNHGLLSSKKGKGGGYVLARPSSRITAGEIIRILDGPLAPIPCVSRSAYRRCEDCQDEEACALRAVMQDVRDALAAILDNTSLADMINRTATSETVLNYDI